MDNQPVKKTEGSFSFLDAPPTWFAMFVWLYPLFYLIFRIMFLCAFGNQQNSDYFDYFFLFVFFASLIFLLQSSRWFRSRIAFIAPCWLFLVVACTSTTQGALTSAVSKAFSAVTSQHQNLSVIAVRERQAQSLEVARAENQLAYSCFHQGKYEESESLFLKSLTQREKLSGLNDPEVAESLIGLGLLYASRQQFEKAIVAHKRALAIDEMQLGPSHPIVATDLRNLASDYKGFGNLPESELLMRRAVAIDGNVPKSK